MQSLGSSEAASCPGCGYPVARLGVSQVKPGPPAMPPTMRTRGLAQRRAARPPVRSVGERPKRESGRMVVESIAILVIVWILSYVFLTGAGGGRRAQVVQARR